MANFSIQNGTSSSFTDSTPGDGVTLDFTNLDNSLNITINGVHLFTGGPSGAPNELEFQTDGTFGQTIRSADGDIYGSNTPHIWQLSGTTENPIFRLDIDPDGTVQLYGSKTSGGPLEPLELHNGMTVNSSAIAAAWNDNATNTIVLDQNLTGPTNASGQFIDQVCFTAGTLIRTPDGSRKIETLSVGDEVLTLDGTTKPLRWIGRRAFSSDEIAQNPKLRPIRITTGSLGPKLPMQDLLVSRQHRVLVQSEISHRMFGQSEVLVPAIKLTALPGIFIDESAQQIEYFHLLFDAHEVIYAEGAPAESLYLGSQTVKAFSDEARAEIETIFPDFESQVHLHARVVPTEEEQQSLVARHAKNQKSVLMNDTFQ